MPSLTHVRSPRPATCGLRGACLAGALAAALWPQTASSGQTSPSSRPLIGLALSGGSARGMAHAGVLQWLEEHHIPVDRIAGNSTGALMGASYATGLSAQEIKSLLHGADWDTILRPDIPYPLKSYRRKEDDRDFSVKLEAGLRHGLRLQSGINPAHHLGLMISRILLPYSGVSNFDDLPIPFRCVATDLDKGEIVVFDRGPIAPAVRASMSLPGTYDPVRLNGRLFADGGILNNIPVDVARNMGADIVIAVRVGPRPEEVTPETIHAVANRAITLMMQALERPKLQRADVIILPDLDGLTAADFKKSDELISRGYAAAEAQKESLLRYALDDESWAGYRASVEARKTKTPASALTFVAVDGVSDGGGLTIARQLSRHIGTSPKAEDIDLDLNRIVGLGRYASATYGWRAIGDTVGLEVHVREKSYAPPSVRFSLDVNNENEDVDLNLGSRITLMDVTGLGSEGRVDASLGSTLRLATEWYQPLGEKRPIGGGIFLSPRASYTRTNENLYASQELVAIYGRQRAGAGLDVGWHSSGSVRFRAGYSIFYARNTTSVGDPGLPRSEGAERSLHARFDYDGRNAPYLASRGIRVMGNAQWFMEAPAALRGFGALEASLRAATRAAGNHTLTFAAEGGAAFGGAPPLLYQFGLGGPSRLGAFPAYAFRGPKFALGTVGYRIPMGSLPRLLGGGLYAEILVEAGSAFESLSRARLESSLTAGLAADTLLGPFFAGASVGHHGDTRVYFLIGRLVR